jgi:hypothetical protein
MRPPECAAWISTNPKLLVELAGRFRSDNGLDTILARFGAVSALLNVHYWSITDRRWERLFTSSVALDGADLSRERPDFTVAELKSGRDTYFAQRDNRSSNQVIYRLRVRSAADSAAIEIENVTPVKYYLVRLYPPGSLRFMYLLHRASPGVWEYYSLMEVRSDASSLTEGFEGSYINRTAALFRHIAGIPTDQEPPAVR